MDDWRKRAANVRWDIRPFVGGGYRASAAGARFTTAHPYDETLLSEAAAGSADDIDAAVAVARSRFEDGCWSALPAGQRAQRLLAFADRIVAAREELALLDALEMGKPISAALWDAEFFAAAVIRSAAGFADKLLGESVPLSGDGLWINSYEPRGVVGAITPWNFPTVNATFKLAPALAAGNTLVIKPSEIAPSSTLRLAELALEAGIPEGVFNVVPGLGATAGAALAGHRDVDLISFTGSTAIGRAIMAMAGSSNAKPVLLELGGKSPHIVFADVADLDMVADAVVQGFLWNQGQVCSANTRLVVDDAIADTLGERIVARASAHRPGDPLDPATGFGPLASGIQRDRVLRLMESAVAQGATPLLLGEVRRAGGAHVAPSVFDQVEPHMQIACEEVFGPVLCIQRFANEAQALALANATPYGLAATIWTRDLGRAKRFARQVRAGAVSVRTSGAEGAPSGSQLSHEPQRASGFGAELGLGGLKAYSTLKSIHFAGD